MIQSVQQYVKSKLKEGFAEYVTYSDIEVIVWEYADKVIDECAGVASTTDDVIAGDIIDVKEQQ